MDRGHERIRTPRRGRRGRQGQGQGEGEGGACARRTARFALRSGRSGRRSRGVRLRRRARVPESWALLVLLFGTLLNLCRRLQRRRLDRLQPRPRPLFSVGGPRRASPRPRPAPSLPTPPPRPSGPLLDAPLRARPRAERDRARPRGGVHARDQGYAPAPRGQGAGGCLEPPGPRECASRPVTWSPSPPTHSEPLSRSRRKPTSSKRRSPNSKPAHRSSSGTTRSRSGA